METAPLRSFATWARTELITEVSARIAAVLAPGSSERIEESAAIKALETAVNAAGDDSAGRAKVADKVAYTWFNRIIALRFIDANGYAGTGIVSPPRSQGTGQPEVLAAAKRGIIDTEIVSRRASEKITALLDGTRQSRDPQAEAFSLLLAEYCRYWHRSMPFMFEREGDYTELLIPSNLLADDSILNRAVTVLTPEVCQDVEVIGWLYQFYISERKGEVFAGLKKNEKAGPDEIPAATQLFTPHWIVRYLVENTVGRLWMLNHPRSRLVDKMVYYIAPVDEETDYLEITTPEELTVIDPACGSGHMLTYAFDLLYLIYEEQGYAPSEIPGLILTHNLYGTEIDPRAGALAAFALTMKAAAKRKLFVRNAVEPNVCVLDPIAFAPDELDFLVTSDGDRHAEEAFWNQFAEADTFGSLIQPDPYMTVRLADRLATPADDGDMLQADVIDRAKRVVLQAGYLTRGYHVAVANPPYMSSGSMTSAAVAFASAHFPSSKTDAFAMFIERCLDLVLERGLTAMITMHSWMFLSSYEKLRARILTEAPVVTMAHLGARAFDSIGGEVVATTAFVLQRDRGDHATAVYIRAVDGSNEDSKRSALLRAAATSGGDWRYFASAADLRDVPSAPIAYWLTTTMRESFQLGSRLGNIAAVRKGMVTTDNDRFVRQWHEVSSSNVGLGMSRTEAEDSGRTWFPQAKGGSFRKWYGNLESVVNWRSDGDELKKHIIQRYGGGSYTKEIRSEEFYFQPGLAWSAVSTGDFGVRVLPEGTLFNNASAVVFPHHATDLGVILMVLNSSVCQELLHALAPTLNFVPGTIADIPIIHFGADDPNGDARLSRLVSIAKEDWDSFETSWSFMANPLVTRGASRIAEAITSYSAESLSVAKVQQAEESEVNRIVAEAYGLDDEIQLDVPLYRVSLTRNVEFRYGRGASAEEYAARERTDVAKDLVSYAVGCMFGRYSLDEPGLILADQGATLQDYLEKVPSPTFMPDRDNVIPIVDGDWFEDDIIERFRRFLRAAFGEQHFEENLRFVTKSLGVKNLRDYFVKSFYKDHVQRYKKRPIYWLFSSPKGSFNALIYLHRYTPSTASTVLNEYLREFQAKLQASLAQAERSNNAREADRLRKVLVELSEYEHDVLYPLATQQIAIDLDDGVKANYPSLGGALKKIPGLEATE